MKKKLFSRLFYVAGLSFRVASCIKLIGFEHNKRPSNKWGVTLAKGLQIGWLFIYLFFWEKVGYLFLIRCTMIFSFLVSMYYVILDPWII